MIFKPILFGILLLLAFNLTAQKKYAEEQKSLDKALKLFNLDKPTDETDQEALNLFSELSELPTADISSAQIVALACQKEGVLLQLQGNVPKAKSKLKKSIHVARNYSTLDSVSFSSYLYLGGLYYSSFSYDSCYLFLQSAEQLYGQNPALKEAGRLFNMLGVLYFESGDYRQSIPYFTKAIEIRNQANSDNYALKINLAIAQHQISNYDTALKIYKELKKNYPKEEELLLNLASLYLDLKQTQKAEDLISQIVSLKSKELGYLLFKLKGDIEFQKGRYQQALPHFENAGLEISSLKGPEVATLWINTGKVYIKLGQYKRALEYFQKAIVALSTGFESLNVFENPVTYPDTYTSYLLIESLNLKAQVLSKLYLQSGSTKYKKVLRETYELSLDLAIAFSEKYKSEASRIDFIERIHESFTSYTDFLLESKDFKRAFEVSDRRKAIVLSLSISESEHTSSIPDSLIQKERFLQMKKSSIIRRGGYTEENLGKALTEVQLNISRVNRQISAYGRNLKEEKKYLTEDKVKELLSHQEALLSFYEGKTRAGVFCITKSQFSFFDLGAISEIKKLKDQLTFLYSFKKPQREVLNKFYNKIFSTDGLELEDKKAIIISSDGLFHGVPFDILLDDKNKYLIEKWAVSYIFNTSFLTNNIASSSSKVLAVAPFAKKPKDYSSWFLPESEKEVAELEGTKLLNAVASKASFLEKSKDFGIIHLATHARIHHSNADLSYIQFFPDSDTLEESRLYLHELIAGTFNNPLVFLSACETFGGSLTPGEGVRGLSYGFTRAGASGVISSLWKAEDHSTAALSQLFYNYLSKGFSKPVALQKAKLSFMSNPEFARFNNPCFWGHLIFTGHETYKVDFIKEFHFDLLLIVIIVCSVIYFYFQLFK